MKHTSLNLAVILGLGGTVCASDYALVTSFTTAADPGWGRVVEI